MNSVLPILIIVAAFATLAVLGVGVVSMLRGGKFNQQYGNRLMQLRVLLQFVAICLLGLAFLIFQK
ncbi:MAG: twin transmembrane helix small protein [Rhodospirillales bacterium]